MPLSVRLHGGVIAFGNALGNSIVEGMKSAPKTPDPKIDLSKLEKSVNDKLNQAVNEIAAKTSADLDAAATQKLEEKSQQQREVSDAKEEAKLIARQEKLAAYRANAVTRNAALADDLYSKQSSTYEHQKNVAYEETQRKFRELGGSDSSYIEVNLADGGDFPSMTLDPVRNGAGVAGPWSLGYLNSSNNASPVTNSFGFPGPWEIHTSLGPWKSGYVSSYQAPAQLNLIGTGWMTPYNELMTKASPYLAFAEHIPSFSFSNKFGLNPNTFSLSSASNSWQIKTYWANNASNGWTRPFSIASPDLVPYSEATNSRTLVSYNQGRSALHTAGVWGGRALGGVGVGFSIYDTHANITNEVRSTGSVSGTTLGYNGAKLATDIAMTYIGVFGGPIGAVVSIGYFAATNFGGDSWINPWDSETLKPYEPRLGTIDR